MIVTTYEERIDFIVRTKNICITGGISSFYITLVINFIALHFPNRPLDGIGIYGAFRLQNRHKHLT